MQVLLPLPEPLRQWLTINADFYILTCHSPSCQQAINPNAISRHLREKHHAKVELQRQADQYLKQWQWQYDFRSVPLPLDGYLPQPVLPIIKGFQCQDCDFKTQNRQAMRKHSNKEHSKKGLKDKQVFRAVQL